MSLYFSKVRNIFFQETLLSGSFRPLKLCIHNAFRLDILIWPFQETTFDLYIYETETVNSWLCYIKDLIFLGNNIVWLWNSLNVQTTDSSVELYNILSYWRFLCYVLTIFCTSFWKVHNTKEIVSLQALFWPLVM